MRRGLAVPLLLALAATGCGKGSSNSASARLDQTGFITQAATASLARHTAKIAMTETVTPPAGQGSSVNLTGQGEMDMVQKLFDFKMNFPAELGISGAVEMIMSGTTMFMQIPEAVRRAGGLSKPWLGMKIDTLGGSSLGGANLTDPGSIFDALRSVASSVTKVGEQTVRGVSTTKYAVTLDMTKIASKVPAAARDAVSHLSFDHLNVYVSSDNLVRREDFSMNVGGASITTTMDIFDYGAPVHITIPASSDVEFKSLQELMSK